MAFVDAFVERVLANVCFRYFQKSGVTAVSESRIEVSKKSSLRQVAHSFFARRIFVTSHAEYLTTQLPCLYHRIVNLLLKEVLLKTDFEV